MQSSWCTARLPARRSACQGTHSSSSSSTLVQVYSQRHTASRTHLVKRAPVRTLDSGSNGRLAIRSRVAAYSNSPDDDNDADRSSSNSSSSSSRSSNSSSINTGNAINASLTSMDDLPDATKGRAVGAIRGTLDELTTRYKRLDERLDKDYISSVVSLRECLLEYEWRQHGKILAERKGVTKFERHCAENDIDIPFEFVSQLYKNPHDMSVLGDNNKLKLMARCIIMEAVDEQYSRTYAECTELAQELARTGISDIIPEGAEKMAGTIKSLIPMPAFLKKLF